MQALAVTRSTGGSLQLRDDVKVVLEMKGR